MSQQALRRHAAGSGGESPTAVYRFYSADGSLIYVGITGSVRSRFDQHQKDKPRWPEVARKTVRWYRSAGEAAAAEDAVIAARAPLRNRRKRSGLQMEPAVVTDKVGIYAAAKGIPRRNASFLVIRDPAARLEAKALHERARERAEAEIAERFAKIRREAPGDIGDPYDYAVNGLPPRFAAVGLRVAPE